MIHFSLRFPTPLFFISFYILLWLLSVLLVILLLLNCFCSVLSPPFKFCPVVFFTQVIVTLLSLECIEYAWHSCKHAMHRWINSTKLQSVICESLPPCHPCRSCSKSCWTSCLIFDIASNSQTGNRLTHTFDQDNCILSSCFTLLHMKHTTCPGGSFLSFKAKFKVHRPLAFGIVASHWKFWIENSAHWIWPRQKVSKKERRIWHVWLQARWSLAKTKGLFGLFNASKLSTSVEHSQRNALFKPLQQKILQQTMACNASSLGGALPWLTLWCEPSGIKKKIKEDLKLWLAQR